MVDTFRQCQRVSPQHGSCGHEALPDKKFCHLHSCPVCGLEKASYEATCAIHAAIEVHKEGMAVIQTPQGIPSPPPPKKMILLIVCLQIASTSAHKMSHPPPSPLKHPFGQAINLDWTIPREELFLMVGGGGGGLLVSQRASLGQAAASGGW